MPEKNVRKAASDSNLRLIGDKIKLESRPSGKDSRASSKCSMLSLGPSRPVSAVPCLNFYEKEDYDASLNGKTRRPVSAPFDNNNDRKESSDIDDGQLSSKDLLKSLLAEPIVSWRNNEKETGEKEVTNWTNSSEIDTETLSVRSCTSESSAPSLGAKIQEVAQNGFAKLEITTPQAVGKELEVSKLLPGITGKPPLPRRKEARTRTSGNFTDDLKDCLISSFDYDKKSILEDQNGKSSDVVTDTSDYESRGSSEPETEMPKSPIQFQNWVIDEAEAERREIETDLYLKSLKKQNEEIQELIKRSEMVLEDSHDKNKFEQFFREENAQQTQAEATTNDEINDVAQNAKLKATKSNQKLPKVPTFNSIKKSIETKAKKNFVATPMRHYKEYQEKKIPEVESWMSKNHESPSIKAKADYSDVLDSVKELEKVVQNADSNRNSPEEKEASSLETSGEDDDITSILEVLEAQDKTSHKKMESMKEIVKTELALNKDHKTAEACTIPDKSNALDHKTYHDQKSNTLVTDNRSSANYNNILSFLDEVERNSCKTLDYAKERVHSATKLLETALNLDTVPKLEDLLSHTSQELSNQIIDLTLRLKEKSSSIQILQSELSTLREQVVRMTRQTDEVIKLKLRTQKDEFESIVKRHQKFIDQLIADKKSLNQQCEGLVNEMKAQEERHGSNLRAMEHKHRVELQKTKDMQMAGEKIRRERWIDNKTQKIKEMTVKSIEPELQSMTSRHQQEIADLRLLHKREIEDLELKAARKTQQQCEKIREQLTLERERAIAHEREVLRQRYDSMVESEEKGYQDQRRRLQQEHANRVSECEEREVLAVAERDRAVKQVQEEFEDKLQAAVRRHSNDVKLLKEKSELEMETWKNNFVKQQNAKLAEKETQIREYYRKERDREIENIIERLEAEATETKTQIEQTTENRIRRVKEKYEHEMRDLEVSEKECQSKCNDLKAKLLEAESDALTLTGNVKLLEQQLRESQELSKKMSADRSRMKDDVQEEVKDELEKLQGEIAALKDEKEKEMQQVYSRVRVTVARKDELLADLSRDHKALQEKCAYLENMLEQQRKEYLMK